MRKSQLVVALAATLLVAVALPARADPPTAEITADCGGEESVTFDFILGDGSIVGFVEGDVAVIHQLAVHLRTEITVVGGESHPIPEVFFEGAAGSQGLGGLTECHFGETQLSNNESLGPLTKGLVKQAEIFFGVDLSGEELGSEVTISDWTWGTIWVQFPGS